MGSKSKMPGDLIRDALVGMQFVNSGDMRWHGGEWRPDQQYRIIGVDFSQPVAMRVVAEYSNGNKSWYPLNTLREDSIVSRTGDRQLDSLGGLLSSALVGNRFVFSEEGDRSGTIYQVNRKGQIYTVSRVECCTFGENIIYADFVGNGSGAFTLPKMLLDLAA